MSLIETLAYRISASSRAKKFSQFLKRVAPQPHESIVDVGVNTTEYSATDNYLEKFYDHPEHITAVGMGSDIEIADFQARYPKVTTLSGDGRSLPFAENSFDISYSNAVIEHVGNFDDQRRFLSELYRVSRRGYLTTPNRHFPIELHTRIPFFHLLLSKKNFDRLVTWIGKGWAAGDYMSLLSESDLRRLLSDVGVSHYTIIKNRFCGLAMTYTIIWHKD